MYLTTRKKVLLPLYSYKIHEVCSFCLSIYSCTLFYSFTFFLIICKLYQQLFGSLLLGFTMIPHYSLNRFFSLPFCINIQLSFFIYMYLSPNQTFFNLINSFKRLIFSSLCSSFLLSTI